MNHTTYHIRDRRTATAEWLSYILSIPPETGVPTGSSTRALSRRYETYGAFQEDLRALGPDPSPDDVFDLVGPLWPSDPTRSMCEHSGKFVDKVIRVGETEEDFAYLGVEALREILDALESHQD
jgi:hypothetical protein